MHPLESMKPILTTVLFATLLLLVVSGCRGEIRNPAALTPMASPPAIAPPTSTTLPTPSVPPPVTIDYVVQEGDTLFDIAQRFGVSVDLVRQLNGLAEDAVLQVGQVLQIPEAPAPE